MADRRLLIERYTLVDDKWETVVYAGQLDPLGDGFTLDSVKYVDDWRFWLPRTRNFVAAYNRYSERDVGPMVREANW